MKQTASVRRGLPLLCLLVLAVFFVGTASAKKGQNSNDAVPDTRTFREVRQATLQALQDLCEPDVAAAPNVHYVAITTTALQFTTGILFESHRVVQWEKGAVTARFTDIEGADFKWQRCSEADPPAWKAVVIKLKSQVPAHPIWLIFSSEEVAHQFVQDLNWLVSHQAQLQAQQIASAQGFKTQVVEWRNAAVKPTMPETAREHKVLAEDAVQQKNFSKAIDEYDAALQIFPTWPEGQFNMALICGETGDYECAVEHMQNYLELVPDAPDAQAAKDKIIVWKDREKTGAN